MSDVELASKQFRATLDTNHGTREEMLVDAGLTSEGLLAFVCRLGRHEGRTVHKTARAS